MPALAEPGDADYRDAGAVAEEIELLQIAGVVGSAAFVEGDEDRGVFLQDWVRRNSVDDLPSQSPRID